MSYSSMTIFQGIPAMYNIQPAKIHKRRTATSIMAGYFDPCPLFSIDRQKDPDTSSSTSTMSIDEPIAHVSAPDRLEMRKISSRQGKRSVPKNFRVITSMTAVIGGVKAPQIKQVSAEEKENAASVVPDGEPAGSLLPAPPLLGEHSSLSPSVISENEPKSSGTIRAHASISPVLSSLKRQRTPDLDEGDHSGNESKKKIRLSESVAPEDGSMDVSMASSDPCTTPSNSPMVGRSTPDLKDESAVEKLTRADAPKLYEVSKSAGVHCKLCSKLCVTVSFMELHLRNMHSDHIDMDALPKPTERRPRGPRKNVAIKKGWKGWVEDEPAPQNLILLDKPEVLPGRTTRSGRKRD